MNFDKVESQAFPQVPEMGSSYMAIGYGNVGINAGAKRGGRRSGLGRVAKPKALTNGPRPMPQQAQGSVAAAPLAIQWAQPALARGARRRAGVAAEGGAACSGEDSCSDELAAAGAGKDTTKQFSGSAMVKPLAASHGASGEEDKEEEEQEDSEEEVQLGDADPNAEMGFIPPMPAKQVT